MEELIIQWRLGRKTAWEVSQLLGLSYAEFKKELRRRGLMQGLLFAYLCPRCGRTYWTRRPSICCGHCQHCQHEGA